MSSSIYRLLPNDELQSNEDSDENTLFDVAASGNVQLESGQHRGRRRPKLRDPENDHEVEESQQRERETYTVEDAVEAIGMGWFQLRIYIVCGIITASDALEMMLLAVLSPVVRCEWSLSDAQVAFVTTVVFIGMGATSPFTGLIGDKYGRKSTLLLVTLTIGFYGLLTSLSPSYYWLLFLRGLVGIGMSGSPQGTSLLSEYIPRKYRAKMLIFGQIFWAVGIMFEILLASLIVPRFGWRWLLVCSAVPSLCTALGLLGVPESARYLLAAGQREKAIQVLEEGARKNKSPLPKGVLVSSSETARGQFSNLFSKEYKRATFQLWIMWFGMAFYYYGMVLASTEILRKYGANGDKSKCHCSYLTYDDYVTMILSTLGEFACLPINWILIDWLGRRINAAFNLFCAGVLVALLQFDMSRGLFTILLFGIRGFSAAYGNMLYIYTSEIYPTTIRTLGMGTASAWARVGAMTTPFVAQVLLSHSLPAACWLYAMVCFLCCITAYFMPIETKGRELPQSISMEMVVRSPSVEEEALLHEGEGQSQDDDDDVDGI